MHPRSPINNRGKLMCVGQEIRSCSATDIHCVTVKRHEHYHRAGHQIANKKQKNNKTINPVLSKWVVNTTRA